MKLYLFPNTLSEERRQAALRCTRVLAARFDCRACAEDAAWLNPGLCRVGAPGDCDAVVAFGGDGTMLRAARTALAAGKPLLGVNTGRLGYLCALTEPDLEGFDEAALRALQPSQRTLIEFDWHGETHRALNELMIAKNDYGTTLDKWMSCGPYVFDTWNFDSIQIYKKNEDQTKWAKVDSTKGTEYTWSGSRKKDIYLLIRSARSGKPDATSYGTVVRIDRAGN